jgi:tRNA threonylcarbamoyladenosine biosynthesis protein TsaE
MSSKPWTHITRSVDATRMLGQRIGHLIKTGLVIALTGDLGSGKTALVQGLAKGLNVPTKYYITSPTYTLVNQYPGRMPLYHVDLYRVDTLADAADIGLEELLADEAVVAIEWADRLAFAPRHAHLAIDLAHASEHSRRIVITSRHALGDAIMDELIKGVEQAK